MSHRGFMPPARAGLLRHAVRDTDPLDQRWLRELTELPVDMLELMALDYAHAMGKLRGSAGELTVAGCGTRITCGTNAFPIGMRTGGSPVVDSILGETTLDGILCVLDIPRELLIAGDPPYVTPAARKEP